MTGKAWGVLPVAAAFGIAALVAQGGPVPALAAAGVLVAVIIALFPRSRQQADARSSSIRYLLLAYLIPLVAFGRFFALVGHRPVFLPDVLAMLAAVLMLKKIKPSATAPLTSLCVATMLLVSQSVYNGYLHDYPGAVKGFVLGLYPLVAAILAAWLAQQDSLQELLASLPRIVLPLAGCGLAILTAAHIPVVPSSYGLYLGVGAAFAVVPGMPRRRLLAVTSIVGLILLVAVDAKRGPTLAIILGACASWLAAGAFAPHRTRALAAVATLCAIAGLALVFSIANISPARVPLVGHLIARATSSETGAQASAANNVALREKMWHYALSTTATHDPLLGMGAYHPIEVTLASEKVADEPETGVHDSFIGYTFFAGYPAGLLVAFIFAMGLWRTWKVRRASVYAPALFGALVVVIITALTNVALETTYIGGPSWMILGGAAGLSAYVRRLQDRRPAASYGRGDGSRPEEAYKHRPTHGEAFRRKEIFST